MFAGEPRGAEASAAAGATPGWEAEGAHLDMAGRSSSVTDRQSIKQKIKAK